MPTNEVCNQGHTNAKLCRINRDGDCVIVNPFELEIRRKPTTGRRTRSGPDAALDIAIKGTKTVLATVWFNEIGWIPRADGSSDFSGHDQQAEAILAALNSLYAEEKIQEPTGGAAEGCLQTHPADQSQCDFDDLGACVDCGQDADIQHLVAMRLKTDVGLPSVTNEYPGCVRIGLADGSCIWWGTVNGTWQGDVYPAGSEEHGSQPEMTLSTEISDKATDSTAIAAAIVRAMVKSGHWKR